MRKSFLIFGAAFTTLIECIGQTPISVTVTVSVGSVPIWQVGTNIVNVGTTYAPPINVPGITIYTISNSYTLTGCTSASSGGVLTLTVTTKPGPDISILGSDTICYGNSTTLTASGATNYTWVPSNIISPVTTLSPTVQTTYTVLGSSGNCVTTQTIEIYVKPITTPTITNSSIGSVGSNSICIGSSGFLSSSAASSYTWLPSGINTQNINANSNSTTTYTLNTVTNGCNFSTQYTLHVVPCEIISTFAGNDTAGYSGEGGVATLAELNYPNSVVADAAGNVYISDATNNRIRKVNPSGIISTFAGTGVSGYSGDGGSATSAKLNNPNGITIDNSGNIYFADNANNVIRKINNSGVISTICGTETAGYSGDGGPALSAKLKNPSDLAIDASGNIYIADNGNYVVRVINPSGTISTFVGNGTFGYGSNGVSAVTANIGAYGVTVDYAGNVYISDGSFTVYKVNSLGIITIYAGGNSLGYSGDGGLATQARLYGTMGIQADNTGNILIADYNNYRIRKVDTSGIISTLAGNGISGSFGNNVPATTAFLNYPNDICIGNSGYYIADAGNNIVRKIGNCSTPLPVTITWPSNFCSYYDIVLTANGANSYSWNNGAVITQTISISNTDSAIVSVTGANGSCLGTATYQVHINSCPIVNTIAGNGTYQYTADGLSAVNAPIGTTGDIYVDASNNIYYWDNSNYLLRKINTNGILSTIAGNSYSVTIYTPQNNIPATSAYLNHLDHIQTDKMGNIFFTANYGLFIYKIDTVGILHLIAGTGTASNIIGNGAQPLLLQLMRCLCVWIPLETFI